MAYSNLTNFNTAINNAVEAGEIKPSDRPNYFTAGSDLLDCGLYISGRFNIINISGWFTVNRASNNAFDTFHILTLNFQHYGRIYSLCLKTTNAREVYVLENNWFAAATNPNGILLWCGGLNNIVSGDNFTFSITIPISVWIN